MQKTVFLIVPLLMSVSANGQDNDGDITAADKVFIDRIVTAYDNFVLGKSGENPDIRRAYGEFFRENAEKVEVSGKIDIFLPAGREGFQLMRDLIDGKMDNSFVSATYSEYAEGSGWYFDTKPALYEFTVQAAEANGFWKEAAASMETTAAFSTALQASLVFLYDLIDFGNRDERFLVALIFFDAYISQGKDFKNIKKK